MAQTIVEVYETLDELQLRAAEYVSTVALRPTVSGRDVHVTLSGGSTPRRMHELLADDAGIDWSRVHLYWGDERTVPPDSEQSNFRMARETLLERVAIPPSRIHRMRGEEDPRRAAWEYEAELREHFGVEPPELPRFDLIVLGVGADGHTASLFPGTAALDERERWVVANEVPQLNTTRITLTYPVLNNAAMLLFLVAGADKVEAIQRIFAPTNATPPPAASAHADNGVTLWMFDAKAAAGLPRALSGGVSAD
jgi:6-phosphogluconolactonase